MGLHVRERRKLRHIEESLRRDDPGLDALLSGRSPPGQTAAPGRPALPGRPAPPGQTAPPGRPARRVPSARVLAAAGVLVAYLLPPALLVAGLVLNATWLIVAGAIACPLIPATAWLAIRRHFIRNRGFSHCRKS